jgi:hypothetical protein
VMMRSPCSDNLSDINGWGMVENYGIEELVLT